jgi:hypothetical protein
VVGIAEIEKLLENRVLLSDGAVSARLAELEADAQAERRAPLGSEGYEHGVALLKLLSEYRALRALARRHGWSSGEDEWPLRPEARQRRHAPAAFGSSIEAAGESPSDDLVGTLHEQVSDEASTTVIPRPAT